MHTHAITTGFQQRRQELEQIFRAGLERVDPYKAIRNRVSRCGDQLQINAENQTIDVDLRRYRRLILIGAGKASAPMARAFEEILGERINAGLVCVKEGHGVPLQRITLVEAAHPIPDQRGLAAARRIAQLARAADEQTLVINCISGGASALLPYPLDPETSAGLIDLSLEDKQTTTRLLLGCGASIQEINCVRKHLSAIKGGRLLQLLAPARSLNFILSDVVGDDPGSIASGLTSADPTTFVDALKIIDHYQLRPQLPATVLTALARGAEGDLTETVKPTDQVLEQCSNILIGANRQALLAAQHQADALGYRTHAISAQITGEARHAAKVMADIARDVAVSDIFVKKPACLLFGGETVVTLTGNGKGGRNQELALAFLQQMHSWSPLEQQKVSLLAASTDGNDGPTDAAGAFADGEILTRLTAADIDSALFRNDSYNFFNRVKALLKTGPTNTNVCDLQIILIH